VLGEDGILGELERCRGGDLEQLAQVERMIAHDDLRDRTRIVEADQHLVAAPHEGKLVRAARQRQQRLAARALGQRQQTPQQIRQRQIVDAAVRAAGQTAEQLRVVRTGYRKRFGEAGACAEAVRSVVGRHRLELVP